MVHRLGVTPFVSVTSMTSQPQLVTWHGLSLVQFRLSSLQIRIPNPATTKRRQTDKKYLNSSSTADPNFILKISSTSSFSLHGLHMLGKLKQSYIENLKGKRKEGEGKGWGKGEKRKAPGNVWRRDDRFRERMKRGGRTLWAFIIHQRRKGEEIKEWGFAWKRCLASSEAFNISSIGQIPAKKLFRSLSQKKKNS